MRSLYSFIVMHYCITNTYGFVLRVLTAKNENRNKTIEKQTQYCKQIPPLSLSLIHLSNGAFDAMSFRIECHHLIRGQWQWFFFKQLKFWKGHGYGHSFATVLCSFLLEWSSQHTHIQNTCKPSLCLLPRTQQLSLAEAHRHVGGTHKCVVERGIKVLRIKNSTPGQPFPLCSASVTPQRLPHVVTIGIVRQDSGGKLCVPWK